MNENRIKEYTLEDGSKFTAYIPENITSETPVFYYSYIPGTEHDTDTLWLSMEESMAQVAGDAIVIIPHDNRLVIGGENPATHLYQNNAIASFNLVKEDLGTETGQFINGGWSAGFGFGTRTLAQYLEENPDADRQLLFAVDGVINPTANLEVSELQALQKNNTIIVSFTQQINHQYQANRLQQSTLPILYVVDNSIPEETHGSQYWSYHNQMTEDFFAKGLYQIFIDFSLEKSELKLPEGYSLRYYDPNTREIREITVEEAALLLNIEASSVKTKISAKRLSALSTLANLNIESDDYILENHLNEIRSTIRNTSFLQGNFSHGAISSTTQIPSLIPELVNQFFSNTTSLLEIIAEDTAEFAKIGSSIVELDEETTQEVEQITDTIDLSAETVILSGSALAGTVTGTVSELPSQTTTQENEPISSEQTDSTPTNTVPSNNTNNNTNSNTPTSQPEESIESTETTGWIEDFHDYDALCSDDTKIVYNCNDEYKIIIHKDGDTVTGIEYYYDFGTEESALNHLETLQQEYCSVEHFDQLVQKDQYIKVLFKEDMFKGLTLTDIKEKFSLLEEIIK